MLRLYTGPPSVIALGSSNSGTNYPYTASIVHLIFPCAVRLVWILAVNLSVWAACLPMEEAAKHVGETVCVHGKVLTVSATAGGTHLLHFCEEGRNCAFSAVVFPADLKHVGDVRVLQGKEADVHGKIHLYHGQPEIIVRDSRQLKGEAVLLPPIPKNYDVANRGKYSPGQWPTHRDRTPKAKHPRRGAETVPEIPPEPE